MHATTVVWLRPTFCDSLDCSPPGSSVHGISQVWTGLKPNPTKGKKWTVREMRQNTDHLHFHRFKHTRADLKIPLWGDWERAGSPSNTRSQNWTQGCRPTVKSVQWLEGMSFEYVTVLNVMDLTVSSYNLIFNNNYAWQPVHKILINLRTGSPEPPHPESAWSESESHSAVSNSLTPWTTQSMDFSRPEYWSGQPYPSPGGPPNPGIEPRSPALQVDSSPAESQGTHSISIPLPKIHYSGRIKMITERMLVIEKGWKATKR